MHKGELLSCATDCEMLQIKQCSETLQNCVKGIENGGGSREERRGGWIMQETQRDWMLGPCRVDTLWRLERLLDCIAGVWTDKSPDRVRMATGKPHNAAIFPPNAHSDPPRIQTVTNKVEPSFKYALDSLSSPINSPFVMALLDERADQLHYTQQRTGAAARGAGKNNKMLSIHSIMGPPICCTIV